jgi:hypothetical protein
LERARRAAGNQMGAAALQMLQSIRIDGTQLQDGYAIRLDNALPKRDPRDRDPGVSGCK